MQIIPLKGFDCTQIIIITARITQGMINESSVVNLLPSIVLSRKKRYKFNIFNILFVSLAMEILKKLTNLENQASQFGFKWETPNQILSQIKSEIQEIEVPLKDGDQTKLQEEIGDLLHAVFSLCIFCQFPAKETLLNSINKFERRFNAVKTLAEEKGLKTLNNTSFDELMKLWEQAKKLTFNHITLAQPILLKGKHIQLELLQKNHYEILKTLSEDDKVSTYSPALKLKFDHWFEKALQNQPEDAQISFIIRRLQDNKIIGSTRFYQIDFNHKRLAIGYTWCIPEVWGTGINTECKFLLLNYAFNILLMNRAEFYIDERNARSRAAIRKLGAIEEGVLRKHIILEDDYVRNTVVYSILKEEWNRL